MYGWEDGRKERRDVGKSDGCCCSLTRSCPALHDLMDCSTPGLPVLYHLPVHKFMSIESVHFLFIVFNKLIEEALGLGEGCFGGGWLSCWKDHDGLPSVNPV